MTVLLALLLIAAVTLTPEQKNAWGEAHCEDVADAVGYHICGVMLDDDGERMWLHYGCESWDPKAERWSTDYSVAVVPYRWTDVGLVRLGPEPVAGCPRFI